MSNTIIGVDFGNFLCKIGIAELTDLKSLSINVQDPATPTIICFEPKRRLIGESGKTREKYEPLNTIGSLKQLVAQELSGPKSMDIRQHLIFPPLVECHGSLGIEVEFHCDKRIFSATQLIAAFLHQLLDRRCHSSISGIVIAVPSWYTFSQRQAMLNAAYIANLHPISLIDETTAIALHYGITQRLLPEALFPRQVIFIDIGQSASSVCVAAFAKGRMLVKSVAFRREFGGRDIDHALALHFAVEFDRLYKIDVLCERRTYLALIDECQAVKEALSSSSDASFHFGHVIQSISGQAKLTRQAFHEIIGHLLAIIPELLQEALDASGLAYDDISVIELRGGSICLPSVRDCIRSFFRGNDIPTKSNHEHAVAEGATYAAAILSGQPVQPPFALPQSELYPFEFIWDDSSESMTSINKSTQLCVTQPDTLDRSTLVPQKEEEAQLYDLDLLAAETEEIHDTLVDYIDFLREALVGPYAEYAREEEITSILQCIAEIELWLLSANHEDMTVSAYEEHYAILYSLGETVIARYQEAQELPEAVNRLRQILATLAQKDDEDVLEFTTTTLVWLNDQFECQALLPKNADPILRLGDIGEKVDEATRISVSTTFQQGSGTVDIINTIPYWRQAVKRSSGDGDVRAVNLCCLGIALATRFKSQKTIADLHEAISSHESGVELLSNNDPHKAYHLKNLSSLFHMRYEELGGMSDLIDALHAIEDAMKYTPHDNRQEISLLQGRASDLRMLKIRLLSSNRSGNLGATDKDEIISDIEEILRHAPNDDPNKTVYLTLLAILLRERFTKNGDVVDIDKAIETYENLLRIMPTSHNKEDLLDQLRDCFLARYRKLGEAADLDNMLLIINQPEDFLSGRCNDADVSLARKEALDLIRADMTSGMVCGSRIGSTTTDNTILMYEKELQLPPDGKHHFRWFCLGISYRSRFEKLRDSADLDKAILSFTNAARLLPDSDPEKAYNLNNLGRCLSEHSRDEADLWQAISIHSEASRLIGSLADERFTAATEWAKCARLCDDYSGVLDAYASALDLLPRLVWLGLSVESRHQKLSSVTTVACDAAASAVGANDHQQALAWLEQGRSIVWGQTLQLRTPLDSLHKVDPQLTSRFKEVSAELNRGSSLDSFMSFGPTHQDKSRETGSQRHRRLAEEWESLVNRIRAIKGFENFLRVTPYPQLADVAQAGSVVVLNISGHRCDALILTSSSQLPLHVPLVNFSYSQADDLRKLLGKTLSNAGLRFRDDERHVKPSYRSDNTHIGLKEILAVLWSSVVKPVLDCLALQKLGSESKDLPRIWWCPTGPLAFLPIHAAGIYSANGTESIVSLADFAISSYTPTLTALLNASRKPYRREQGFQLLAVAQPNTPGASQLPATLEELDRIQHCASKYNLDILRLEKEQAMVGEVSRRIDEYSWVHLACHGVQDPLQPMKSALLLQDGRLELSEIIKKSLPHADFAFLSACQTAAGDDRYPDEAIHLAAGMLLSGYRGVVATMWSIGDQDAPIVAGEVYTELFKDGTPDSTRAARALHHAVQRLRRKKGGRSFFSWVPFIHVGV